MNTAFRRKSLVLIAFIPVAIALIALGVRLPRMIGVHSPGPKPKPRAVIVNQIKTCKNILKKQGESCAVTLLHPTLAPMGGMPRLAISAFSPYHPEHLPSLPGRSPPRFSL
jgi:hypothetical protein